jgi:NADH-quinone oxidoreductase subunit M
MLELPYLSLVVWTPILGGIWVLLASGARNAPPARAIALIVSLVTFLMSLPLWGQFDIGTHNMQFEERSLWIETFRIYYHLGVDGISMPLILLTTFTTILVVLAGWEVIEYKQGQYMAAFLIQEGLMIGAFSALTPSSARCSCWWR